MFGGGGGKQVEKNENLIMFYLKIARQGWQSVTPYISQALM